MALRRKNVELIRLKRSSKKSRFYEVLSSPCVQYLLIFLLWGLLLVINQSTEMRFEYFWPGWLFICSTHDSLKYQGMQYTIIFVIIVLTTDLLFFFLFPASWIYFCGSAYVWIYLLWHTDQGLCFLTLTFCLTFVYFELGFQSRDVKFNHSIYLFRPFAAHSIGYPVVCMGFSIKRYLEVRHRKHKTLDVRRQNCLYFRILREALPVPILPDFSSGTYPAYLPDYDMCTENSQDAVVQESSGCSLSWSLFMFSQLATSCFSRLGQWCSSYPLPLERELASGPMVNSRTLCPRSMLTSALTSEDNHLRDSCGGFIPRSTGSNGRSRHSAGIEAVSPACSNSTATTSAGLSISNPQVHTSITPVRQTTAFKASTHSSSQGPLTTNSTLTYSRCLKENPVIRLESTSRRLKAEVQSMRAVESQLRNQMSHLRSESNLNRQSLSSQRQENESMAARISKMNTRSRSERSNLATLEQSIVEEKRLRSIVEEALGAFGTLSSLVGATSTTVGSADNDRTSVTSVDRAVQSIPVTSGVLSGLPDENLPHHRNTNDKLSAKVTQDSLDYSCCQRRRLLESEVRNIQQEQLANEQTLSSAAKSRGKLVGRPSAVISGTQRRSRVRLDAEHCRYTTATGGGGQTTAANTNTTIVFDPSQVLVSEYSTTMTTTIAPSSSSSQLQCQRVVLETYIQVASEERERLARKLREDNWMKQDLLTAYHASVKEITDLTNTLKQRDGQISELSHKVEQFERYLACGAAGAVTPADRARTSHRSTGGKKPGATWWVPSSALPGQGLRHRQGKPTGLHNPNLYQPSLTSILCPSFVPASHVPPLNEVARASGAVYSVEHLSRLLPSTSTTPSAYRHVSTSPGGCNTDLPLSSIASADDGAVNCLPRGFIQQQENSVCLFDDFQLTVSGGGELMPSITSSQAAVSLLVKGTRSLRGALASHTVVSATTAASPDLDAYTKLMEPVAGSTPTRQLATESR